MKKFTSVTIAALGFLILSSTANAAEVKYPYSAYVSGLDSILSAKYESETTAILYENGDAVYGTDVKAKGVVQDDTSGKNLISSSNVVGFSGTNDKGYETKMNIVQNKDVRYVQFTNSENKKLRNKWIKIPTTAEYTEFADALGLSDLFEKADLSDMSESDLDLLKKQVALAEKFNLYRPVQAPVVKKGKKGTTTYELEFNPDNVAAYFKALGEQLTKEQADDTLLGLDGFKEGLANKYFVKSLADSSDIVIVMDNTTMLPISYYERQIIPAFGKRVQEIDASSYVKFSNINKKVKVSIPSKTITTDQALDL